MTDEQIEAMLNAAEKTPVELLNEVKPDLSEKPVEEIPAGEKFIFDMGDHTKTDSNKAKEPQGSTQSQPPAQTDASPVSLEKLIGADVAINVMEMVLPATIAYILKQTGKTIDKNLLSLTDDERKTLSPVMDNLLKHINLNLDHPVHAFILTVGIMYGMKGIEAAGKTTERTTTFKRKATNEGADKPRKKDVETRGRHKTNCGCPICVQRRNKLNNVNNG